MSTGKANVKPKQDCQECSRKQVEIARVYRGHRYCRTCYAREFKHRPCPRCGETARLPREFPKAVCRKCERTGPCVRCERRMARIGLRTPYGPACPACAPYFREPEPCDGCGEHSKRLTRVARLGHDLRVCPRCARADHGTCAWCKRPRVLAEHESGEWLCKRCREEGEVPCPSCGEPMPAGRGNQCQRCYVDGLADRRTRFNSAAFSTPTIAWRFMEFGAWLKTTRGPEKAAQRVHRFLPFFLEIESEWGRIPAYGELLEHFGAKKLRSVLLAMRWMEESGLVKPDSAAREADSDRRRIKATLGRFQKGSPARMVLESYRDVLEERLDAGRSCMRSVRLALSPAASLLETAIQLGRVVPDQKTVDAYLRKAPGQRAAVSGFIAHLRDWHGAEVALPRRDPEAARRKQRQKLRAVLLELMRGNEWGLAAERRWMATALACFHGVPRKAAEGVDAADTVPDRGGMNVHIGDRDYWIPRRARPFGDGQSSAENLSSVD